MKYLKSYKLFESNLESKLEVDNGTYGWDCRFECELGKGNALLFDNINTKYKSPINLKENELFLFGINTNPTNIGIGKIFLREIFNYFNIDKVYLPSDENHPTWNKMATKTDQNIEMGNKESTIFSIDRSQLG